MTETKSDVASDYRIEMRDVSKSFGPVSVLQNVDFKLGQGQIHALVGENGAGKSTLMKILCGVHPKEGGQVFLNGTEIRPKNTHDAQKLGISIVYQELSLINDLSVAENIYLHKLGANRFWMNWKDIVRDADELIRSLDFQINPKILVRQLSPVQKQVVEIAKALSENPQVLVLDEPTTVFDPADRQKLFDNLFRLKKEGTSIIYISHHLKEILEIADRVTVLKDGKQMGSRAIADIDENGMIKLMIGRELTDLFPERNSAIGNEPIFEVEGLTARDTLVHDVSFSVRPGEVLGIAGLGGSGRTETAKLIFGADRKKSGTLKMMGKKISTPSPARAVAHEIGFVPEDRKEEGVFLPLSVRKNISLTNFEPISNFLGFINVRKEKQNVSGFIEKLRIKTRSTETVVKNLSGGNQQKVALAKWLGIDSKIVIIDEPTRGVDVGAKVEIYKLINELSEKGMGVIVISSDMPEIMGISDRILVMHEGSIQGELPKEKFTEENILRLSIGKSLN